MENKEAIAELIKSSLSSGIEKAVVIDKDTIRVPDEFDLVFKDLLKYCTTYVKNGFEIKEVFDNLDKNDEMLKFLEWFVEFLEGFRTKYYDLLIIRQMSNIDFNELLLTYFEIYIFRNTDIVKEFKSYTREQTKKIIDELEFFVRKSISDADTLLTFTSELVENLDIDEEKARMLFLYIEKNHEMITRRYIIEQISIIKKKISHIENNLIHKVIDN
jgi:hypothetical protein